MVKKALLDGVTLNSGVSITSKIESEITDAAVGISQTGSWITRIIKDNLHSEEDDRRSYFLNLLMKTAERSGCNLSGIKKLKALISNRYFNTEQMWRDPDFLNFLNFNFYETTNNSQYEAFVGSTIKMSKEKFRLYKLECRK